MQNKDTGYGISVTGKTHILYFCFCVCKDSASAYRQTLTVLHQPDIKLHGFNKRLYRHPFIVAVNHGAFFFGKLHRRKFIDTVCNPAVMP